jgi:3-isopropylmalate dehydrogenase
VATYDVALLPGDGIGPEVVREAVKALECVESISGGEVGFRFAEFDAGAGRWFRTGSAIDDETYARCAKADAILLGAMGLPEARHPDGREAGSDVVFRLRFGLDLYAGIRPVRLYPGVPTPLREGDTGIDYVLVRENTEGLYASRAGGSRVEGQVATDTSIITRSGTHRIAEHAFELARRRRGRPLDGRQLVTSVDKANVLSSYAFFRAIVEEVAEGYEDVALESVYVDAMALYLVRQPAAYDVIVAENMFGDILSDLGAATVGGLGLAPSADLGDAHGLFQPAHGSAPDIAGTGTANPAAAILSAAMMLDWLGRRSGDEAAIRAGNWIEQAVAEALVTGEALTRDLGGAQSTAEAGDAVARALERIAA